MANNQRDTVGTYVYKDDAGNNWSVKLTGQVAAAGGFTALGATAPANFKGSWKHPRKMRHVGLKVGSGNAKVFRNRVPISDITSDVYKLNTLSVSLDGRTWAVTGRIGEKVTL